MYSNKLLTLRKLMPNISETSHNKSYESSELYFSILISFTCTIFPFVAFLGVLRLICGYTGYLDLFWSIKFSLFGEDSACFYLFDVSNVNYAGIDIKFVLRLTGIGVELRLIF